MPCKKKNYKIELNPFSYISSARQKKNSITDILDYVKAKYKCTLMSCVNIKHGKQERTKAVETKFVNTYTCN